MKTTRNHLTGLFIGTLFLLSSCQKEDLTPTGTLSSSSTALRPICGKEIVLNLNDKLKAVYGSVILSNDQQNFYVKIQSNAPWVIKRTSLWTGQCEDMDEIMHEGSVLANLFNHHSPVNLNQNVYEFTVALSSLTECFCYSLYVLLVDQHGNEKGVWAEGQLLPGDKFGTYGNYCVQKCHTCGGLRTQTQGGWGAVPHGNNPGAYLHAHFAAAFPSGLIVGCNRTITLTSAQAVTNFLPQGGSPKALTTSYVNPTNKNITVLAGQVVALKLSVVFDEYDPNFGAASDLLKNRVIVSGPFQGWTVAQLLAEAEKKLGGCASPYSFSQLNSALDAINNNYANGNTDLGYLTCPK